VRARSASIILLAGAARGGGLSAVPGAGAAAPAPCTARVSTIDGHRAISYCGPATVTIDLDGRIYRFHGGLCDVSKTVRGLALNVGTLVAGAPGNAGRPFVSLVIAHSPSESDAFEADSGGQQLFTDTVLVPGGPLFGQGTFESEFGVAFSGSWDCDRTIFFGP
jgi:hypothetical protein